MDLLEDAQATLRDAVACRDSSVRDARVLAPAWTCDADTGSHGRDVGGAGWRSWFSASLLRRPAAA